MRFPGLLLPKYNPQGCGGHIWFTPLWVLVHFPQAELQAIGEITTSVYKDYRLRGLKRSHWEQLEGHKNSILVHKYSILVQNMASVVGRPQRTKDSLWNDREKLRATEKAGGIPAFSEYSGISESYLYRVQREGSKKGFSQKTLRKLEAFLDSRGILKQGQTSFTFERGKPVNILPLESPIKMEVIEKKETVWIVKIELRKPVSR